MNLANCVPKNKSDFAALDQANRVGFPALNPVLPELLVWLQDMNWPVAERVAALLSGAGEEILPHIRSVLSSNDSAWKYWVLTELVPNLDVHVFSELTSDLVKLAESPAGEDREESVDEAARRLLG